MFQTEKAIQEVGDKLDANDKAGVEADCKALKEILEKVNMDDITDAQITEIKAGKEKLSESATETVHKRCMKQAGASCTGSTGSTGSRCIRQDQRQDGTGWIPGRRCSRRRL